MTEPDLDSVRALVESLASDDAFVRRDAIERLAVLTQQRLDYRWSGPDESRARAIRRWRRWIEREEKQRRAGAQGVESTIQILAGGELDKQALAKALKGLPPAQKKALMAQVLAKMTADAAAGALHAPCDRCSKRPATARVTSLGASGAYELERLCEICAHHDA